MKHTKRWLAALLSAVLLMSLLPTAALADETLSDNTPVTATSDITRAQLAEMVYSNEKLKTQIDLGGGGNADPNFQDISTCTPEQQTAINALYRAQILSGTSSTTFTPNGTVTRGEAVVVIWRATGSRSNRTPMTASFNDLAPWYAAAVNCFYGAGMLIGTGNGAFSGDQNISVKGLSSFLTAYDTQYETFLENTVSGAVTRAEIAVRFYNEFYPELSKMEPVRTGMPFTDLDGCTVEQKTAIEFFYQRGIISGATTTTFAPYGPVSNLQLATLLKNCATANAGGTSGVETFALTDAFQFLVDNGASRTEIEAANDNPNAPGLTANLVAWNNALKPEMPEFSLESGTIEAAQDITIHTTTADAAIRYTIDGSDPTASSTASQYTDPISITEPVTIKAVAVKNNLYSDIASAMFTVSDSGLVRVYPITIIGPTGEIDSYVDLHADGTVYQIQGSDTTLFDPRTNSDTEIQKKLRYWVYNGWMFTAEKDGETENYGPTKVIDNGLKAFLNDKIKEGGWTLTMNSKSCGYWAYPITIIGPTGEMNSYVDLYENGTVYQIQGSDTTLFDPRTNPDTTIQEQLRYWVYNGWMFTAEKDGETTTYGPTKYVDDDLKDFLNPLIADNWTLTMNSKSCGYYDYPDRGSSGSSSNSGNKTETTKNPDGSTTTTVTKPNGTVTETTKNPDGSSEVVETQKNGTTTTTTTDTDGNKTEVLEKTDGSSQTTVTNTDGSSSITTVSAGGQVEAQVKLPAAVVHDAARTGEAVALPMPEVPVTSDRETAPTVTVSFTASTSAKVEIPVANVTAGTVAILVQADGTEQVVKTSVTTENGVSLTVESGVTVKIVDNAKDFVDVPVTYWASDAIDFATSRELFAGTSETTFTPAASMTRVMIVTVLARCASNAPSSAIGYAEGQQWAVEAGISDGSNMSGTVTRQQMAAMLYRYAGSPAVTGSLSGFPDAAGVSDYAADAMTWAVENGLITGMTDGTLNPYGLATRAQVATILQRFVVSFAE